MTKKIFLVLLIAAFAAAGAFAQEEAESAAPAPVSYSGDLGPMNTVTADIGPLIIGLAFWAVGDMMNSGEGDDPGVSTSGFGIGIQYERQIFDNFSVAGRFAYLGVTAGMSDSYYDEDAHVNVGTSLEASITSFSIEAHARWFPFAKRVFFLGGMLGYGYLSFGGSGSIVGEDSETGQNEKWEVSESFSRSYLKLGAKLGWRIDFGRPGGFTFEPSFGWSGAIGLGDTFGKQLTAYFKEQGEGEGDFSDFDEAFSILEQFIFIGGPRLTLSFGWRF
jgi:hypothetical protein